MKRKAISSAHSSPSLSSQPSLKSASKSALSSRAYVAFLRGINVGGKMVKMAELKKAFESLHFTNVSTLLNSGNVVFKTSDGPKAELTTRIESCLERVFGFPIDVVIRTKEEISELIIDDPFKHITVEKNTRLYVTFFDTKPVSDLQVPYVSPHEEFRILAIANNDLLSVLLLTEGSRTPDAMNIIEKKFGKKRTTTRNWNTVQKVLKKMED